VDGPNSGAFPVRPLTYLVDPARRSELLHGDPKRCDINVNEAVVFIGDGIADLFNTPLTHHGLMQMSGTEVLAQSLNTILSDFEVSRTDEQFNGWRSLLICLTVSAAAAVLWLAWCQLMHPNASGSPHGLVGSFSARLLLDAIFVAVLIGLVSVLALLTFLWQHLLVPVIAPSLAIATGALTAIIAERNRQQRIAFESQLALTKHTMRSEFVRRINHDLNAPVTVLNWALADMRSVDSAPKELRENIAVLLHTSDRLCMLIDEMSRSYQDDQTSTPVTVVDLRNAIADSVDLLTPLAKSREGTIECKVPDNPVYICSPRAALVRIFDNLIKNALRHNPKGTTVQVHVKERGGEIDITVSDDGIGIPADKARIIYESSTSASGISGNGQGMGLGIVRDLVNELKGNIRIVPQACGGSRFNIRLPKAPADASTNMGSLA